MTIADAGTLVSLAAGPGCSATSSGAVTCPAAGVTALSVDAGDGDDRVTLAGIAQPATVIDGAGDDRIAGGSGNDTFLDGPGADTLTGGAGEDMLDYSSRANPVTVTLDGAANDGESGEGDNAATDVEDVLGGSAGDGLAGSGGANALRGNGGPDTLDGGGGNDLVDGGDGDDVLDGGLGADAILGGPGVDRVSYESRRWGVSVSLDNAGGDGQSGEGDNVHDDVEDVTGGSGDDALRGDADANALAGGPGNDTLSGNGGDDVLSGAAGNDRLYGADGKDTLDAGVGDDRGDGGAGDDRIDAGDGNDSFSGGDGNDAMDGGSGNDSLGGGDGNDAMDGGSGNDSLGGGDGDDRLGGGEGNDALDGGRGADALQGADGNDRLAGNDDADTLDGGAGEDQAWGGSGGDAIDGGAGDDRVWGEDGSDTLTGGDGDDVVGGGRDDDHLTDPAGDNRLTGDAGNDEVRAGIGSDVVSGGDGDDLVDGGAGTDRVWGDGGRDRVQGGDGADELHGGDSDDVLDGGRGPDAIDGDSGQDTVDYGARVAGVSVSNDGKPNDGAPGELDDVDSSVDDAIGGAGDDRLTFTSDWPHHLDGGPGRDRLQGGPRADTLTGGAGADLLIGGPGKDAYDGGAGNDHLSAADAVTETLRCGAGRDVSVQDRRDTAISCEKRTIGSASAAARPDPPAIDNAVPVGAGAGSARLKGVRRRVGGGRFVAIPGSPGMRIDRRLLADIAYLKRRYRIAITAGLAMHGHADGGEHPRGLALDIVPGPGGSWNDVDRLAKWAEPRQNHPRAPFRWVGYNGDAGHGRGDHLHLSWRHSATKRGRPARWVMTMAFASTRKRPAVSPGRRVPVGGGRLVAVARRGNRSLGGHPSYRSGIAPIGRCQGYAPLAPAIRAAASAFGIRASIIAGIAEIESNFGCAMGPSTAGAIGWTQFMPATWKSWGMDADGDGRADPYNSVDAVFSTARYLRASGAPRSYRRALFAYNHATWYVNSVLRRAAKYRQAA